MYKYRTTVYPPTIRKFARIAQHNDLFHPLGTMYDWYSEPDTIDAIALAYYDTDPVGVSAICDYDPWYNFGVFIRPDYRRQGIGSRLVRALRKRDSRALVVDKGGIIRAKFYDKLGL